MRKKLFWYACLAYPILCTPAISQDEPDEEELFELSPFVVNESEDIGYLGTNTLSGGRFNTRLADTAASVSVFTQEFLEDVGIQDIDELAKYSVGTVIDTGDAGAGDNINRYRNAKDTVTRIRIRGLQATKGRNYFQAITPDDGYRNGRYDESRGPNGILFGISNAGGMVNSSTYQANLYSDDFRARYTTGSWNENRAEFRGSKVLIEDKLAVALAGLYEDSDGWRDWTTDQRERLYAAITVKPINRLTIRAMYETGDWYTTQVRPFGPVDRISPWIDYGRPSLVPNGANPPNDIRAQGVTGRNGNNFQGGNRGRDPRHVYIENIGEMHNLGGTYITSGYNDSIVEDPETGETISQLPNVFGGVDTFRINDPENWPYHLNLGGPAEFRESDFDWWQVDADLRITKNWYLNVAHNDQNINMRASHLAGDDPQLYGEANLTLGVVPADPEDPFDLGDPDPDLVEANRNPFVGQFYVEGDHRYEERLAEYEESRVSMSYDLITDSWFGNHRLAVAASQIEVVDLFESTRMAFLGAPFHNTVDNNDNLIWNRYYLTEGDYSTYAYQQTLLPYRLDAIALVTINDTANPSAFRGGNQGRDPMNNDGVQREVGWVRNDGFTNNRTDQKTDAYLAVTQSTFWNDRIVVTLGYREDQATFYEYGFLPQNKFGFIIDQSAPTNEIDVVGESKTAGLVFHLTQNFSLIANYATSIGLPDFNRKVLPPNYREAPLEATVPPPPDSSGTDFGISFNLMDNKISGRLVYYTTESTIESNGGTVGNIVRNPNRDIMEGLGEVLVDQEGVYTAEEWAGFEEVMTTNADAMLQDTESEGWEFSLVANPTRNWRIVMRASYTDRRTIDSYKRAIPWLGYTRGEDGFLLNGFTAAPSTNPDFHSTTYTLTDPSVYTEEGTVSRIIGFVQEASAVTGLDYWNLDQVASNRSIAEQLQERQWFRLNDKILSGEQRWSLRPYKANIYTAYDFREGFMEGFSIGGGVRWQAKNIIGGDAEGNEFEGVDIFQTDFMLRYRQRLGKNRGTITYQLNVYNVFDDTSIIPQRLATTPDQMIPGGRGIAYTRFDFQEPRSFRFSITYDF